jgi:hypothetical protein
MVPIYRVVHEPLRAYLLYTSAYLAVRGVKLGWNKLQRTGLMDTVLDLPGHDQADSAPRERPPIGADLPAVRVAEKALTQ